MYQPTLEVYKTIINESPNPVYLCMGPGLIIALANKATLNAWGKNESVLGKPFPEALPELKGQPFESLLKQVYLTGKAFYSKAHQADIEINGCMETFYFDFSYQPFMGEQNEIKGVFCFATDVTGLVLANKATEKAEKNLHDLILHAPVAICIATGPLFKTEVVNDAFLSLLNKNRADFEGKQFWGAVGEGAAVYSPVCDHVFEKGAPFRQKNHRISFKKNGIENIRVIDFVYEPIKNEDQVVYAVMIIGFDVTEIRASEEKSAMLAAIVESTDDAIISKTMDGYVTSWNPAAEKMFGYGPGEMIGQSILKIIPGELQHEEANILLRLNRGERMDLYDTKRLTKSHQVVEVCLTISPIKDNTGRIIGISKIARDITYRKQEEQRKSDFISIAGHELKTPLTSAKAHVQLLLEKASNSKDKFLVDSLARVEKQMKRMTSLVYNILDNSRFEHKPFEVDIKAFNLHTLLLDIIKDARSLSPNHEFKLLNSKSIMVLGDHDRIAQVMENLVSNSIKYSPGNTCISIDYQKKDGFTKVSVSDEGVGISKNDQKRLFQRFYRVSNEKMKHVSGFGIGLFIVAEILDAHQSKIFLESDENIGSKFYFSLACDV